MFIGTGRLALDIGIGIATDLSPVVRYVIVFNMQNYGEFIIVI